MSNQGGMRRSAHWARTWLRENGFPYGDDVAFEPSRRTFSRGGSVGVELPAVNTMKMLTAVVKALEATGAYCTRFNETHGAFLRSDSELKDMMSLCTERGYGIMFGLGPRPEYDYKASFYRTEFGMEQGRRLNNNDAVAQSVEEAHRLAEMGCRGLIVYDPGVLRVLRAMRDRGVLPSTMQFKTSSHVMVTNPMIASIMRENGADSVTTAHDLGLPVLQEMRSLNPDLIIDIPVDVYATKGGYLRFYEVAELAQVAGPMFLKVGASAQAHPYDQTGDPVGVEKVRRLMIVLDHLARVAPDLKRIHAEDPQVCLPQLS
jgi:Peptidase family U32